MDKGYEPVKNGENYWYVDACGEAAQSLDTGDCIDEERYSNANYYSDRFVAENNSRADILLCRLRRFAARENTKELDWNNPNQAKWYIEFSYEEKKIQIDDVYVRREYGQIYFSSEGIAKQAIEQFEDDLMWYFTEYQDHIVTALKAPGCEHCGDKKKLAAMKTLEFNTCSFCGEELEEL